MRARRHRCPPAPAAALAAVALATLACAQAALAHVEVKPASVEATVATELRLDVPNERAGKATVSLEIELPRGLRIVSAVAPDGWGVATEGRRAIWSGGRIEARESVSFALTTEAGPPARRVEIVARQRYDDGGEVTWRPALLVLPAPAGSAPEQHLGRALAAGVVGLAVVAASLAAVGLLRRRRPRDG